MRRLSAGVLVLALATGAPAWLGAAAQTEGRLGVELNKLEPMDGGGCRVFFVFRNRTGTAFERFEMALALFDRAGVVDRLLTVDAAPLPPARTTLKLFEVPGLDCGTVSEVLLHDLPACAQPNRDAADCFGLLDLSSRTPAPLVQ